MSETQQFINQQSFVKESVIINKLATFSDDDDSSFDSEEEEKLLTPPIPDEELIDIDWEYWSKVVSEYHQFSQSDMDLLSIQVQQGIPSALRGTIWPLLATHNNKFINTTQLQEQYIELLKQESIYDKAITCDLHRTFPHHPFFQSPIGRDSLFNVVRAYSIFDQQVGYCQGLSFVAGPLLLFMPEEEAFCILVQLMQNYDIRGHYTPQLDLLRQRLFQFDGLLLDYLPHVHRHFAVQGVRSNMYASQWFLTLFAYKFPLQVVYRIYDTLFTEGVNCLFRIGLALLAKNQATILSLDFDALVLYLKDDMLNVYKDNITDLLNESFIINISTKRLDRLARDYQTESEKADNEAELMESLRQKNRVLTEQHKSLEIESEKAKSEFAQVAKQLEVNKKELLIVYDENDALKQQTKELKKALELIPRQIEKQVDLEPLCLKNQSLNLSNALLEDQLADMEALLVDLKLKYAQSESENDMLNQKFNDLKKWMNK